MKHPWILITIMLSCVLCMVNTDGYANTFAADLAAPEWFTLGFDNAVLSYRLNDDADTVEIEIFGPDPDITVRRTLDTSEH